MDRDFELLIATPGLDDYEARGGGTGLRRATNPDAVISALDAAGLRGRGGAGFPTARKWQTVLNYRSARAPTTVVVNAAEGEPGSFKDRAILRANPYAVLEGALIAARTVGADRIIVATKRSFTTERQRLDHAIQEMRIAGWTNGVAVDVFAGPSHYLYGEETALLEVLDGRAPFPRVAPPYRHGVDEVGDGTLDAAPVVMASPDHDSPAPPSLVNNTETFAHVASVFAHDAGWFRAVGTRGSPGTMVFTVTGRVRHAGVAELALGTPVQDVIDTVGGGVTPGHTVTAMLSGVAHPFLPAARLATPASFEDLDAAGGGLGSAGFIVFDDEDDLVAVAAGVSRFLAVESCGQCTPCKQDGLAAASLLEKIGAGATADEVDALADRVNTVADEARCFLAQQHQRVVGSLLRLFPDVLADHTRGVAAAAPVVIVPIADITDGVVRYDDAQARRQPDWTDDPEDSGKAPADWIDQGSRARA